MNQPNHHLADDPEPLLSFLLCPMCNGRRGFGGERAIGWIACGGCGGIGSTREAIAAAEKQVAADHRAWRERQRAASAKGEP